MNNVFFKTKFAVLVYFIVPGLIYGLFTSRLPALKVQTGASESDVGLVLFMFGAGSLAGLLCAGKLLQRLGARTVLLPSLIGQFVGLALEAFVTSLAPLFALSAWIGLCTGFNDVAMNAQGLVLEKRQAKPVMGFLHAGYCIGGGMGSVLGAVFAGLGFGLAVNYLVPTLLMTPIVLWSLGYVQPNETRPLATSGKKPRLSLLLIVCGMLAFLASEAEGSCGDWGGLLLLNERGSTEGTAAAVYAIFTFCALASRILSDRLRRRFSLMPLLCSGAILGICGFLLIAASRGTASALTGVALAGLGVGPVVPMIYSLAGRLPDITAAQASSVVSVLGYTGLLLCPPAFGFIAHRWNYGAVFGTVTALLGLLLAGILLLSTLLNRKNAA